MDYRNQSTQRTVESNTMKNPNVSRLKNTLIALLTAGMLGLGMSLMLPESSDAQSHPQAPQRTAPMDNGPTNPPAPPSPPGPPAQTPIDGGLGLLLAAGGAYGLNKLRKRRKEG